MPGCPARHPLLCARSLREPCGFHDTRRKWAGKQQTQPQKYTRLWSNKVKKMIRSEANVYKQNAHGIYQDASCYTSQILSLINYFLGKQIFYIRIPLNTFRIFTILPRWSLHNDLIFSHIRGDWTGKHKVVKKGWQWDGKSHRATSLWNMRLWAQTFSTKEVNLHVALSNKKYTWGEPICWGREKNNNNLGTKTRRALMKHADNAKLERRRWLKKTPTGKSWMMFGTGY